LVLSRIGATRICATALLGCLDLRRGRIAAGRTPGRAFAGCGSPVCLPTGRSTITR